MRTSLIALLVFVFAGLCSGEERIWVDAQINGQRARLIFDTGADRIILFRPGAKRLKLKLTETPADSSRPSGTVAIGETEPCDVRLWSDVRRMPLGVVDMPNYLNMQADGLLGWGALKGKLVQIDALGSRLAFPELPPNQGLGWAQFRLDTGSGFLALRIPHPDRPSGVVLVDTGFAGGVAVPPDRWQEWETLHPNSPATLDSYFMPGAGLVVKEETWADSLGLGPLSITQVPLIEANRAQLDLGGSGYEASLGLAALKRLDFVVDGKNGVAYLRPKTTPPIPYQHNRLGAVFVPPNAWSNTLIAHLLNDSPAHQAGIANGDELLSIDDLDASKWRSDPAIFPLSHFWMQPAGTKLNLILKRHDSTFRTTVMLRQILGPETDANGSSNRISDVSRIMTARGAKAPFQAASPEHSRPTDPIRALLDAPWTQPATTAYRKPRKSEAVPALSTPALLDQEQRLRWRQRLGIEAFG